MMAFDAVTFLARTVCSTFKTRWAEIIITCFAEAVVFHDTFTAIPRVCPSNDTCTIGIAAAVAADIVGASSTHLNVLLDSFVLLQNCCHGSKAFSERKFKISDYWGFSIVE